jgi:hypothetical protein
VARVPAARRAPVRGAARVPRRVGGGRRVRAALSAPGAPGALRALGGGVGARVVGARSRVECDKKIKKAKHETVKDNLKLNRNK